MLTQFEVTNFKNFKSRLVFDFTKTKNYKFNEECVVNNIASKSLIYGHNGMGKSNLGFAIFDIISHLTDKNFDKDKYGHYLNAYSSETIATFKYSFQFDSDVVVYQYTKENVDTLISETLYVNDGLFASINRANSTSSEIYAKGAETLNKDIGDSKVSILSYISKNAILDEKNHQNIVFNKFIDFINKMLFFRSLDENRYNGLRQGTGAIDEDIISHDNVQDFEFFLNDMGIKCKLDILKIDILDIKQLVFDFGGKKIPFFDIASSGTKSLALFYVWLQRLKEDKVKLVFIDEFDAFYHHELSSKIIEKLKEINVQVIVTTHNTSLITNELLRPDCYFLLKNNEIKSLANRTQKELRIAHNIEKMYKAGSFGL